MNSASGRVVALVLFILLPSCALAQTADTGAVTGVVRDPAGAVVTNAAVTVVNRSGVEIRKLTSGSDGAFTAPLIPPGTYTVIAKAPGFDDVRIENVEVVVTETTRVIAAMTIKSVENKVSVSAEIVSVNTENATTGLPLTGATVQSLPLATENFQQLLALSAGTTSQLNDSGDLGRGDVRIQVNGQREGNNNYQIEGISATDYNIGELATTPVPSPDALQEFKVQTSLYDASQGRNGGGSINAILKSGTPAYHFDIFEFFRNDDLDANDFFFNEAGQARPAIKQNIFGGSAGGPVGTDGKYGYIFGNYQGTRQISGLSPGTYISGIIPVVPTDRSAQSIANAFLGGNVSLLDPMVLKLMQFQSNQFGGPYLFPSVPQDPSLGPGEGRITLSRPGTFDDNQFTIDWDKSFRGGRDTLSERFFFSNFESKLPFGSGGLTSTFGGALSPGDLNFPLATPVENRFISIAETHVFNSNTANELRVGFNRIHSDLLNSPTVVTNSDVGIVIPTANLTSQIYKFTFADFQFGPAPFPFYLDFQNTFTYRDTLSYVRGKHQFQFGAEKDRIQLNKDFPQIFSGQALFAPSGGYTDFENFLQGNSFYAFAQGGNPLHEYRISDYAAFAQDNYRVSSNLTLNLGLRVEITGAPIDLFDNIGNMNLALAEKGEYPWIYPPGVNRFDVPGLVGNSSRTTLGNNFATVVQPRVGFAYNLFGRNTTTIRGGYGIFGSREDLGRTDNLSFTPPMVTTGAGSSVPGELGTVFSTTLPVAPAGVVSAAFVPQFPVFQGFVTANGTPTTDTTQFPVFSGNAFNIFQLSMPQHYVVPTVQQWNLTVQHAVKGTWVLSVGYVGSKGTHLREVSTPVQPYDATVHPVTITAQDGTTYTITQDTSANAAARSRILGLNPATMQLFATDADSIYHSLQATFSHRFASGLYFQAAYTYSKSIDDSSSDGTAFNTTYNNENILRDSRGVSDFNVPQRFVTSWYYVLPFFAKREGLVGKALSDWSVSGIVTYQSGLPFTVIDSGGGTAFPTAGSDIITASLAPGETYADTPTSGGIQQRLNHWLNYSAFTFAPVVGPDGSTGFGTLRRNTFSGPHQSDWDLTVAKTFPLTERQHLEFRTDFFNAFNHPSFATPTFPDVESPSNFTAISSTTGTPRLIQFVLKYSY
jgi:Carboxypeptidase regulatory-like domain